jgi:DNA-binding transcriptional ArsR family regulator
LVHFGLFCHLAQSELEEIAMATTTGTPAATAAAPRSNRPSAPPPAWLAGGATAASELVQAVGRRLVPPPAALMTMTVGYEVTSRAISAAAELGLADHLANGPLTADELAVAADLDATALGRLLRVLEAAGVVRTGKGGRVRLTRLGAPLRGDHPQSVRDWGRYLGAGWHWDLWGGLDDSVRDGRTAYERRFGTDFFTWFAERPAEAQVFDDAMTSFSNLVDAPVAAACDLRGVESVADVGGGSGALLAKLLLDNRHVHGTLFDQGDVVERARAGDGPLAAEELRGRSSFVAGDMFAEIPGGNDAYVLKWILHDWDDRRAAQILERIAAAANSGARLFVVEMLIELGRRANPARQLDLAMLVLTGGHERTRDELRELLDGAGFELRRVRRTASPMHVLEAVRR